MSGSLKRYLGLTLSLRLYLFYIKRKLESGWELSEDPNGEKRKKKNEVNMKKNKRILVVSKMNK